MNYSVMYAHCIILNQVSGSGLSLFLFFFSYFGFFIHLLFFMVLAYNLVCSNDLFGFAYILNFIQAEPYCAQSQCNCFLNSTLCFQGSSMLMQVMVIHSFLLFSSSLSYEYTTTYFPHLMWMSFGECLVSRRPNLLAV